VSTTDALARRYRLLLCSYPPEYRRERGDELIGTLIEATPPGRAWPAPAEAADLIVHGLRRRMREDATPGLAAGLRLAGPFALALAAGLAVFLWLYAERGSGRTIAPLAYATWLVAAAGTAVLPWRLARHDLVAAAVVATALLPPAAALTGLPRAPLWVVASLALCGLVALAGQVADQPVAPRRRALAGAVTLGMLAVLGVRLWWPTHPSYYGPALRVAGVVTAGVLLAAAVTARRLRTRQARWALLALALPAAWLVSVDATAVGAGPGAGRLGQFLIAASTVLAAMSWLVNHRPVAGTRAVAGLAIATAAGLSGYFWLAGGPGWAYPGWILVLVAWAVLPAHRARAVTVVALAATLIGPPAYQVVVLVALGVVALAGTPAAGTPVRYAVPAGAALVLLTALGVGAYAHNWQPASWRDLVAAPSLAVLLGMVALVPGVGAGWRGRDTRRGRVILAASAAGVAGLVLPPPSALAVAPVAYVVARRRSRVTAGQRTASVTPSTAGTSSPITG